MNPEFSLIIPTYNRIDALRSCFKYLEKLHYPKNEYEVVLVDDGSQDATKDLTGNEADIPLRVIHQKNGGAAAARNTGIIASRGRFCLFVDDVDNSEHNSELKYLHTPSLCAILPKKKQNCCF